MVNDDTLYANVKQGLSEAPANIKEVYQSAIGKRPIMEALLLDSETPLELYQSLFGFTIKEVEVYSQYFFSIPKLWPRLDLFVYIKSLPNATDGQKLRQRLFMEVFQHGWSRIDAEYNQQRCFSLQRSGISMMKKIFHKLEQTTNNAVAKEDTTTVDISQMKTIVGLVKEGVKIEAEKTTREREEGRSGAPIQLELEFVKKIQDSAHRNSGVEPVHIDGMAVDQYGRVDTSVPPSAELEQLTLDLKDCGPIMRRSPEK